MCSIVVKTSSGVHGVGGILLMIVPQEGVNRNIRIRIESSLSFTDQARMLICSRLPRSKGCSQSVLQLRTRPSGPLETHV